MEFIRGRSLEQLLREQGAFGPREAALIGVDLCRALAAAHRARVVHRDVKAENVLREEGGRIVLTDFGAGVDEQAEDRGSISGTPFYMAPELFRGEPASPKSDIYSLGILLYHLVTGSFPVEARTWSDLRDKHARRDTKLLRDERPDLPEAFVLAVGRALAWDPNARFATAGQMEQALGVALGAERAVSSAPPAGPGSPSAFRRPALLAGASVIAAALLVAMALFVPGLMKRPVSLPAASSPSLAPGSERSTTPYNVEAALYRVPAGTSVRERLDPGARLSLGDSLTLEFETSAPVHVYVINEDEAGHAYALFPLPGFEPRNPLSPGTRHLLPGVRDGKSLSWTVDSPGGREHLLVLASPDRLIEFEAEMNALARPGQTAVPIPESARLRLRGLGGLSETPSPAGGGTSAGRLFEMAQRLAAGSEEAHGVWMRRIDLENPPGK
jgi:serine/threonine protein kinase